MPRHAPAKSLKHQCIDNVIKHIDSVWCKDFLATMFNQSHWLHILGPFDNIPAKLCHEIFMILRERKLLKKHHVYLLINPHYETLILKKEASDLNLMLHLASVRCQYLKKLDLSDCTKIPKAFQNDFPCFSSLTDLNLCRTNITDSFLSIIGIYGANLRVLDISETGISSLGLVSLFLPKDIHGADDARNGNCTSLRMLNILNTMVDVDGATSALRNLTALVEFTYNNSIVAIYDLLCQQPGSELGIVTLHSDSVDVTDDMFSAIVNACPKIKQFYLTTYRSMNQLSLLPLADRKRDIREFHLRNSGDYDLPSLSIVNALTPALASSGETMVSLNLHGVTDVNVSLIVQLCPSLVHLSMVICSSFINDLPYGVKIVPGQHSKHLETLEILSCDDLTSDNGSSESPLETDLRQLLLSPVLKRLKLAGCNNLTDAIFEEAKNSHSFFYLEELSLFGCNVITFDAIRPIFFENNSLRAAAFNQCEEISLSEMQDTKKILKKLKLHTLVQISWS